MPDDVTQLLLDVSRGNRTVVNTLLPRVYDELRRLAHAQLRRERSDHTLNTTALVHEAYLNLVDQKEAAWQNRAHFFAIAAQAMRRILIDYARKRNAAKRGGGQPPMSLDEVFVFSDDRVDELLALDDALSDLEALDERLARVVEYRYFSGLTIEETAEVLAVSPATVKRDWATAKAWLFRQLKDNAAK